MRPELEAREDGVGGLGNVDWGIFFLKILEKYRRTRFNSDPVKVYVILVVFIKSYSLDPLQIF